jgi:hypothetical protein
MSWYQVFSSGSVLSDMLHDQQDWDERCVHIATYYNYPVDQVSEGLICLVARYPESWRTTTTRLQVGWREYVVAFHTIMTNMRGKPVG